MKKYRLKDNLRQYFTEELAYKIKPLIFWECRNIAAASLEEVEEPYVIYGSLTDDPNVNRLNSWSETDGRRYEFSIFVPAERFGSPADRNLVLKVVDAANEVLNKHYK